MRHTRTLIRREYLAQRAALESMYDGPVSEGRAQHIEAGYLASRRKTATILAALLAYETGGYHDTVTDGGRVEPLSDQEIGDLIKEIEG